MKQSWLNNTLSVAALFSFRMLGLFMLIPVFTIFAHELHNATPALIGLALGGYGLSQGLLQLPFGWLSDRFGRKPMITAGLLLFACGSLLGACTHSIYGMIAARILQGTGAIGSVLMALLADLTPDEQRTKAMAVIGVTIGLSFGLAMVLSPVLTHHWGFASIFYFTTVLAVIGLGLLYFVIPTPKQTRTRTTSIKAVLCDRHLQRLNLGIFSLHLVLTATFYVIPLLLQQQLMRGNLSQSWHFYLPLMLLAFLLMIPVIVWSEKKQRMQPVFLSAIGLIACSQCLLIYAHTIWALLCVLMLVYFVAFNTLEASLPSLVSKQASPESKGTAMGVYSSSQFLGIFAGGALAGVLYPYVGIAGLFFMNTLFTCLWLIVAIGYRKNRCAQKLAF